MGRGALSSPSSLGHVWIASPGAARLVLGALSSLPHGGSILSVCARGHWLAGDGPKQAGSARQEASWGRGDGAAHAASDPVEYNRYGERKCLPGGKRRGVRRLHCMSSPLALAVRP